ncbi:MAG: carbohydrate ABC transporter substrate-binding protein, partial [Solirubrobacteraceae bacterium]
MNGRWRVTIVAAAVAAGVSACGSASPTSPTTSTKRLEVVSWWTSRSEAAALNDLFAAFRQSNPGVSAMNGAVAGGAGSNAIV